MVQNELKHFGVKGMKWGVRRTPEQLGRKRTQSEDNSHDDYKKAHSPKDVRTMSNQELRDANNRLNMERQYKDLTKEHESAGKKFVKNVLISAGTSVAIAYVTKYMKKGIDALEEAITNPPLPYI